MILVDTSVWIEAFRGRKIDVVARLQALLDRDRVALAAPVWLEILSGAKRDEAPRLARVLSALPRFYPSESDWKTSAKWASIAARAGQRFAAVDLVIGAVAGANEAAIWSLDSDFRRMADLGFVRLAEF